MMLDKLLSRFFSIDHLFYRYFQKTKPWVWETLRSLILAYFARTRSLASGTPTARVTCLNAYEFANLTALKLNVHLTTCFFRAR